MGLFILPKSFLFSEGNPKVELEAAVGIGPQGGSLTGIEQVDQILPFQVHAQTERCVLGTVVDPGKENLPVRNGQLHARIPDVVKSPYAPEDKLRFGANASPGNGKQVACRGIERRLVGHRLLLPSEKPFQVGKGRLHA